MATKRQRYEDEEDDSPVWEIWGTLSKEEKRRLPHASARKGITAAMNAMQDLDATMRLDEIVEAMEAITTDIGRHEGESDGDYHERVKCTLGLIPYWSIAGTEFDKPHPYRGCKGLLYDNNVVAAYKIPGDRWIDIYIGASACVLMAEGRNWSRFVEGLERQGDWLYIVTGT